MGLDVYLYRYENKPDTDKREKEYDAVSSARWEAAGEYESLSDNKKDELRLKDKELAASLMLDDYGSDKAGKKQIEMDSSVDKDHYFKLGYFRSSYNGGGINNVLKNLGLPTLYEIFSPNDEYCFQPKWDECLVKCQDVIEQLKAKGNYRCFQVSENMFGASGVPQNEKEAMDVFLSELQRSGSDAYSNIHGEFWLKEPLKIHAIIPGEYTILKKMKCCYVVMEGENEWYIKALEIVKETIQYVLDKPDKDKYWLHWSS